MWANKSFFSHCSITLPPFFSADIPFLPLCLAILATVTRHYSSLDHRLVKWNCPGFPKEGDTSKICPCQMKKKNPECGVTQINDQKKLRMKGGGGVGDTHPHFFVLFCFAKHTPGLIYYKEY